jgi:hypothetical protein
MPPAEIVGPPERQTEYSTRIALPAAGSAAKLPLAESTPPPVIRPVSRTYAIYGFIDAY